MKKLLLVCLIPINLLSMDNQYSKGIEIPGALRPSQDSHSPVACPILEMPPSLYFERSPNHIGQKIVSSALEHYHSIIARGYKSGSAELGQILHEDYKQIEKELAANEKRKKTEPADQAGECKVHELSLKANACVLFLAAFINENVAFQKTNQS